MNAAPDRPRTEPRPEGSVGAARWPAWLCAAWGLLEATVFFVVPDVPLSFAALASWRRALRLMVWTLAGAVLGGLVMFAWATADAASARRVVEGVPAVSDELVASVRADVAAVGAGSMFAGAFTGRPYKVYAVECAAAGVPVASFAMMSVPARAARFVVVIAVTAGVRAAIGRRVSDAGARRLLLALWLVFYAAFLSLMPW